MRYRGKLYPIGAVFSRSFYNLMRARVAFVLLAMMFVFNGCAALEEAQRRREKRILEERDATSLMLRPSKAKIDIRDDALFGESDHYTLKFAEDLQVREDFDEGRGTEIVRRQCARLYGKSLRRDESTLRF